MARSRERAASRAACHREKRAHTEVKPFPLSRQIRNDETHLHAHFVVFVSRHPGPLKACAVAFLRAAAQGRDGEGQSLASSAERGAEEEPVNL